MGALDGTYVNVHVPEADRGRYRTRKGQISTNVLAVCDREMRFLYVLPGWEGSASDARVLRDAVGRTHGLKVPTGNPRNIVALFEIIICIYIYKWSFFVRVLLFV